MTINEIRHEVLKIVLKKDYFTFPKDIKDIFFISEEGLAFKEALVLKALETLEEMKFLKKCDNKYKEVKEGADSWWVIERNQSEMHQTVELTPQTAVFLAEIINQYRKANSILENECDPCNVKEEDVQNICLIVRDILSKKE